jgi:hypothetical protein
MEEEGRRKKAEGWRKKEAWKTTGSLKKDRAAASTAGA